MEPTPCSTGNFVENSVEKSVEISTKLLNCAPDVEYVSGEESNRVAHGGTWIMDGCRLESGRHETGPFFQANRTLSATAFRLVKFGEEAKN